MKLFDLTCGNHPQTVPTNLDKIIEGTLINCFNKHGFPNKNFLYLRFRNDLWHKNFLTILQDVPVFLVDTAQSNQTVPMPGTGISIKVPKDNYSEIVETLSSGEESLDDWFDKKARELKEDEDEDSPEEYPEELPIPEPKFEDKEEANGSEGAAQDDSNGPGGNLYTDIVDCLGMYCCTDDSDLVPRKIFVWVDKVESCAAVARGRIDYANAYALLQNVIYHELGHAVMDVTLYGDKPSKHLSYKDYIYRWYEESLANAFALLVGYDKLNQTQQQFIENFVKQQPKIYASGWDTYEYFLDWHQNIMLSWMIIKVRINRDILDRMLCTLSNSSIIFNWRHFNHILFIYNPYYCKDMGHTAKNVHKYVSNLCSKKIFAYSDNISDIQHKPLGLLNNDGEVIQSPIYKYVSMVDDNGLIEVCNLSKNKCGLLDENANFVVPCEYDEIVEIADEWYLLHKDNDYSIVDKDNKEIISCGQYDNIEDEYEKGFKVCKNGKWGLLDMDFNVLQPLVYDRIDDELWDHRWVQKDGKFALVDHNFKIAIDFTDEYEDVSEYVSGYTAVKKNGKWGIIDIEGNIVKDFEYDKIYISNYGYIRLIKDGQETEIQL